MIDVRYANITFVETQVRAGRGPFPVQLPMIPGNGVGGVVGGRRVIASLGGSGGYAERVAVGAAALFDVPDELALDDAVALLADGRTATMLADAAAVAPGERVLILAAAGGVGTLLVQLAAAAGATVVGAAAASASASSSRSLGAARRSLRARPRPVRRRLRRRRRRRRPRRRSRSSPAAAGCSPTASPAAPGRASSAEEAARAASRSCSPTAPAALRGYTERALAAGLRPVIGQRFRWNGPPKPTPPSRRARR